MHALHEREVALALREITRQHGCEGRIVAACADGTSLDASTAADTFRRIGTKLVAGDDGSRRAEFHTAAAVRAPVGRGLDRHPLRMPLLTAAVTEYEPHEPPHREHPVAHGRQPGFLPDLLMVYFMGEIFLQLYILMERAVTLRILCYVI